MSDDGKRGIYINNDPTVTSRLTQKRITTVPEIRRIYYYKIIITIV
jgi:hypothetical protein